METRERRSKDNRKNIDEWDGIVVGAGLGGLTAGARLAKEGKKVLVLDPHNVPGGCASIFKRKDYKMEVSLHEMDGLHDRDMKREVFETLGVLDRVKFVPVPEFYRCIGEGFDFVLPDNRENAIEMLSREFPEEVKGIQKYFKTISSIQKEVSKLPKSKLKLLLLLPVFPFLFRNILLNNQTTVGVFLDRIIQTERLKLILTANVGYYSDDPYSLSLFFYAFAQESFFAGGGHYIKGGSQELSNCLAEIIEENGGKVDLKKRVTRIITEGDKAIGVEYCSAASKKNEKMQAFGKAIIANAPLPLVVEMLPDKDQIDLKKRTENLEISCSMFSIYIGFKKPVRELGNKHYSTFIIDDSVKNIGDIKENYCGDYSKRVFAFTDYSQIDSGLAPEGKGVGTICGIDHLAAWEGLKEEEYRRKKEEVAQILFKRLEKIIPGIINEIDTYEVGTPKTIQRYTGNPEGTVYGFSQTPKQAGINRVPVKSSLKGLYFASAWSMPGGGFTGTIYSGWACAKEALTHSIP